VSDNQATALDGGLALGVTGLNWLQRTWPWLGLGVLFAMRTLAAALMPLWSDEAYYRLWSHHLNAGYYDHPPMIAWFVWLGVHMVGDNALGARLASLAAAAATTALIYDLARLSGLPNTTAQRASIWFNATLLIGVEGWLALPDAPLTLFWTAGLWSALKAVRGRPCWWLACGVAAGLACLSKYSGLFLAPGLLAWLLASPGRRTALATPWPYLGAAIALAVFAVNFAWNAGHEWVTFHKQFGRVAAFSSFKPIMALAMIGSQAGFLTPAVFYFAARSRGLAAARPLLITSAPFAAYMAFHSLHNWVFVWWLQPLYPILAICAAAAADAVGPGRRWLQRLRAITTPGGFLLSSIALALLINPVSSPRWLPDPFANLKGWPAFAQQLEAVRVHEGAGWVGTVTYGILAHLRTRHELRAPVIQITERMRYTFDGDYQPPDFERPGLILDLPKRLDARTLQSCFGFVQPLPPLTQGAGGSETVYQVFKVANPRRLVLQNGC
jgi:4-amino-4-deoxy-L-arabinose transferase-like glycosyltransferase